MTEIEAMLLAGWSVRDVAETYGEKESTIRACLDQSLNEEQYA